jgi:hypothetical protein
MAKDWETLGSDYEGSSSVLIAEVDCTLVRIQIMLDSFIFG